MQHDILEMRRLRRESADRDRDFTAEKSGEKEGQISAGSLVRVPAESKSDHSLD